MKAQNITLAVTFARLEKAASEVEDVAKGILAAIKAQDARTLDHFNEMVSEAYGANGWSQKAGRPVEGATEKPAPDAVKLYVSTARAGYRMSLEVHTFETMGALRAAIREQRQRSGGEQQAPRPPEMKGISLRSENSLTGALWHDAVVLWEHLPADEQADFEKQVRKLLSKFSKMAPAELVKAA